MDLLLLLKYLYTFSYLCLTVNPWLHLQVRKLNCRLIRIKDLVEWGLKSRLFDPADMLFHLYIV